MAAAKRKPTEQRRPQIGEAALRIVGREGPTALSTSNLAREVGVTTGALFRHFETLDDVLREAVRLGLEKMESTFPDPSLPPLDRIATLAGNRVAIFSKDRGLAWLVRSDQAALMLPSDAVVSLQEFVSRSRKFLLDAIREGVEDGSIRGDIDPQALLVLVAGTIHALVGMPGVHRSARASGGPEPEKVLSGLKRALAPCEPKGKSQKFVKEKRR